MNENVENKTEDEVFEYKDLPPEELRRLALGLLAGTVFTSQHLNTPEEHQMIGSIFMPIGMGAMSKPEVMKVLREINAVFYEFVDKAGPRAVNGYPTFFSVRIISWEQFVKTFEVVEKARALLNESFGE